MPTSQPEPPTLPFRLCLAIVVATAIESPESTAYMNFTFLWPRYQDSTAASSAVCAAPPATSTVWYPAFWKIGLAPSIRGWMLPVPGVAMIMATRSPLLTRPEETIRLAAACTGGEVVLANVGHPFVAGLIGVVGDDRYALAQRVVGRRVEGGRSRSGPRRCH